MPAAFFKILGEIPSRPVALVASNDLIQDTRFASLINGISNLIFGGILLST